MWVYSSIGFHSVVMSDDPDVLVVRGRVRRDLERVQQLLLVLGHGPLEILESKWRDYPYRILAARGEWADVLGALAASVDYRNFKNAVGQIQEPEREICYQKLALITRTLTDLDDEQ
jgi:hypothetical protein